MTMAPAFPRSVLPLDLASTRHAKSLRQLYPRHANENTLSTGLQYDTASGQVYSEVVCPAAPNHALVQQEADARQRARIFKASPHGAASLHDMAMREVMANVTGLTPEIWAEIPWHIGKRIWTEAETLDLPRLSIWKAYVSAYSNDTYRNEENHAYFRASEMRPQFPLEERLGHLESPTMAFITCLTISRVEFSRADIINISKLRNLGALDISVSMHEGSAVDDGVIRNWGRRATDASTQSFPQLRVLLLRNQTGVTVQSFQHLCSLPALVLFGVQGCRITAADQRVALQSGWTQEDECNIVADLQHDIDVGKTWDSPIRSCYEHSARLGMRCTDDKATAAAGQSAAAEHAQSQQRPPLLNFRIGPTPNEVLFSPANSLVFFRTVDPAARRTSRNAVGEISTWHGPAAGSKKRKLRESRQVAAQDILDGF